MQKIVLLSFLLGCVFFLGCESKYKHATARRQKDEMRAEVYLADARAAMLREDYQTAKEKIKTLRKTCKFALEMREQAILLLDSIELSYTQRKLRKSDSLMRKYARENKPVSSEMQQKHEELHRQVKFYERKLQHDKQQRRHHD